MKTFFKASGDELDYTFDWDPWWLNGDTIFTSAWAVDPEVDGELEIMESPAPSHDGTATTVWLTGGTPGSRYRLTNTIETVGGRTAEQSAWVKISPIG